MAGLEVLTTLKPLERAEGLQHTRATWHTQLASVMTGQILHETFNYGVMDRRARARLNTVRRADIVDAILGCVDRLEFDSSRDAVSMR